MNTVFFDLETAGLDPTSQIIQIAAVAVDGSLSEVGSFNRRVMFDEAKASPEALKINHYDRELWKREARLAPVALREFADWSRPFADQRRVSKTSGNPYVIGTLSGYNSARFDFPLLQYWFKQHGLFLPFDPRVRDVYLLAMSICDFASVDLPDYKLGTVAGYFGVEVQKAHDALSDVRTTAALMRRFREMFSVDMRHAA